MWKQIKVKVGLSTFRLGRELNLKPIENAYDNLEFQSFIHIKLKYLRRPRLKIIR